MKRINNWFFFHLSRREVDALASITKAYFAYFNCGNVCLIFHLPVDIIKASRLAKVGGMDLKDNVRRVMRK